MDSALDPGMDGGPPRELPPMPPARAPHGARRPAAAIGPSPSRPTARAPGRRAALSAEALEDLGAPRLAALLMAAAGQDQVLARTLRLAVAGTGGAAALAAAVEKRLDTLARSRGAITYGKMRPLTRELDGLRGTIATTLAEADPGRAAELMRRLLALAGGLLERCEDGGGAADEVFVLAATDLGTLWTRRPPRDPVALAGEVLGLMEADHHGVADGLLEAAAPAFGAAGRAELRRLLQDRLGAMPGHRGGHGAPTGGWQGRGLAGWRLRRLADVEGDVDAYVAAVEAEDRPEARATDVAQRLLAQGRAAEALAWLDRADGPGEATDAEAGWEALEEPDRAEEELTGRAELRAQILDALGRGDEARALRWEVFARWLQPGPLRAVLRGLPGFEDVEAEDRAMALALGHPDRTRAVAFLAAWPNLPAAALLVREHLAALDARDYRRLRPAAEALAERHPVAATLLHRRLVEGVLDGGASRQYGYAARDLRACAALASLLPDEPGLEGHDAFLARLQREHGRKHGFWTQVVASGRR